VESFTYADGVGDEVVNFLGFCAFFAPVLALLMYRCLRRTASPISDLPTVRDYRNTNVLPARSQHERRPPRDRTAETCPICIDAVDYPCETNCGHVFCTTCLVGFWRHTRSSSILQRGLICPCCRGYVTMLLEAFTEQGTHEANAALHDILEYNTATGGQPRTWSEFISDTPVLIRRLLSEPTLIGLFSTTTVVLIIVTAIYVISPLDIISETVFGVYGFVDDISVLMALGTFLLSEFRHRLVSRQRPRLHH